MIHLVIEATPLDGEKEMKTAVSNDSIEISLWTGTRWDTLRTVSLVSDDTKPYTGHLAGFSPEAFVSRWRHSRGRWISSPSLPARRHWTPGSGHELENGGF